MLTEEDLRHALDDLCGGVLTSKAAVEGRKELVRVGKAHGGTEGARNTGREDR